MKTSVVMATYNGKDYLIEQLDSLRLQTMPIDEVLFFDDGSKDNTVQMVEDYIQQYNLQKSWRMTVNEKNLGYANNFHKGLMAAQGEYIFFSDQDDIWCEDKIEKTVAVMDKHPEVKLLCTDYTPFSCADGAPEVPKKIMDRMTMDNSLEKLELNSSNIYIASLGCVMCTTKTFRDEIEPYWKNGWPHDDYVWRLSQCADGCYVYHVSLIKRRLHDHNVSMHKMHNYNQRVQYYTDVEAAIKQMIAYGKDHCMDDRKIQFLFKQLKAIQMRSDLIVNCNLINSFKLLAYLDCYHSRKSVLMEPYLALKFRKH